MQGFASGGVVGIASGGASGGLSAAMTGGNILQGIGHGALFGGTVGGAVGCSLGGYQAYNDGFNPFTGNNRLQNFIYRALRADEAASLEQGNGLSAKNPDGTWTLEDHIVRGSSKAAYENDPYISTTKDFDIAKALIKLMEWFE